MRVAPDIINMKWIDTLTDADLLDVESRLHEQLAVIERREKKAKGDKYLLFRGPADLLDAWDRWSRINAATRERSLKPRHNA
jgi:hypothetical protein